MSPAQFKTFTGASKQAVSCVSTSTKTKLTLHWCTVRAVHDGKVGQPFCRLGSCIASTHPLTLEQHLTVCVCVCVAILKEKGFQVHGNTEANEQLQLCVTSLTRPSTSKS